MVNQIQRGLEGVLRLRKLIGVSSKCAIHSENNSYILTIAN